MTPRERIDAAWYGLTKKRMEAIIVEAVADARRLERETCCRDVCPDCLRGDPIAFDSLGAAIHLFQGDPANRCRATRIRARSRAQSPDAGRESR